jgi:hypothetical protein
MREHDGIIKIESPLVKSMDERQIYEVASRREFTASSPKFTILDIFVDRMHFTPYNARQINKSDELNI